MTKQQTTLQCFPVFMESQFIMGSQCQLALGSVLVGDTPTNIREWYPYATKSKTTPGPWFHGSKLLQLPSTLYASSMGTSINLFINGVLQYMTGSVSASNWKQRFCAVSGACANSFYATSARYQWYYTPNQPWYVERITPGITILDANKHLVMVVKYEIWETESRTAFIPETTFPNGDDFKWLDTWGHAYANGHSPVSTFTQFVPYDRDISVEYEQPNGMFNFKYNEYNVFLGQMELGLVPNFYSSGYAQAYVDMVNDIPEYHSNAIADVIEIAGSITSIIISILGGDVGGAIKKSFRNLKDARNVYLAWRYSYCTTKSDVAELVALTDRLAALCVNDTIHLRGLYRQGDVLFRCSSTTSLNSLYPEVNTLNRNMRKFGLSLEAVDAWDLIPFSFMFDWFIDISSWLDNQEKIQNEGYRLALDQIWVSAETQYDGQTCYMRHNYEPSCTHLPILPLPNKVAKGKTLFMRGGDILSIFSK